MTRGLLDTIYLLLSMATASSSPQSGNVKNSRRKVPESIMDLLDVAVFSFGCQSGLRSTHKIRGDPVIEGVSAFFGRLLNCSNDDTKQLFKEISPSRFGGWQPGREASKELLNLVSSRVKTLKLKGAFNEHENLEVPDLLFEKTQKYLEEEDRIKTWRVPKCWRCAAQCEFCLNKKKDFPGYVNNFNVE